MERVRMEDVARAAGVSVMTVSRALRKDGAVAPATRSRILAVVSRMGYVPDQMAQGLSSRRSGFVAALVPSLNNTLFADTIRALSETIEESGLQVLIGHTNYEAEREERLLHELLRRRPEALVITVDGHTAGTRKLLRGSKIPIVEIWDWPKRPIDHVVGFSNEEVARQLVHYLASRGYRRIAYVGEHDDAGTRGAARRKGYLLAMKGLRLGPPRVLDFAPPPMSMTQGRQALAEVLQRWPDTDAVACVSDPCAFGVLVEAQARGLDVPGTLGIAGFGGWEVARCCEPTLTTIAVDAQAMGREAGLLLNAQRAKPANKKSAKPLRLSIAAHVEPRGSTR